MPVIDVHRQTVEKILRRPAGAKELGDALFRLGMEIDSEDGDFIRVEVTPDRVDMMTPEGIARALRAYMGIKKGMPAYRIRKSGASVYVDSNLKGIREFAACAIVRGLRWTGEMIKEVMSSHGKIDQTYGRRRKKVGLGVYPLEKIKFPVRYCAEDPKNISFIPLGSDRKMSLEEIKEKHPKGAENAHITEGWKKYPVFRDAGGNIMSCPPFVNSRDAGQITENARDVFIEVTGTHWKSVNEVLNIVSTSLAERGGNIYSVKMVYGNKTHMTPDLSPAKRRLEVGDVNRIFGLDLDAKRIAELLRTMMYDAKVLNKKSLDVSIPAIRTDILHELDIIDDVGRAYGFDNLDPDPPQVATVGRLHDYSSFSDKSRMAMIGMGFLEMVSFILTSREDQFGRMRLKQEAAVEILNPKAAGINTARKHIMPELLKCIANNAHREYPQKVFEVGDTIKLDGSETGASSVRKIAAAITDDKAGYEYIASALEAYMKSFRILYAVEEAEHPSFIKGRCGLVFAGKIKVGIVGEIHPQVLNNWNIIRPVAAFELNMDEMFALKK